VIFLGAEDSNLRLRGSRTAFIGAEKAPSEMYVTEIKVKTETRGDQRIVVQNRRLKVKWAEWDLPQKQTTPCSLYTHRATDNLNLVYSEPDINKLGRDGHR
jgi:hypothetical protein